MTTNSSLLQHTCVCYMQTRMHRKGNHENEVNASANKANHLSRKHAHRFLAFETHMCVCNLYGNMLVQPHTHTHNYGHNGDHAVLALRSIQCGQKHMEYVPNSAAGRMTTDSVLLPHTHTRVSAMATHSLHGIRKKLRNDRFNANRRPRAPPKNSSPRICAVARCCNACVVCCVCIPTTATGGLNHGFLAFATHMCVCYDIRISRKRNQCFCKQSKSPQPEACPQIPCF